MYENSDNFAACLLLILFIYFWYTNCQISSTDSPLYCSQDTSSLSRGCHSRCNRFRKHHCCGQTKTGRRMEGKRCSLMSLAGNTTGQQNRRSIDGCWWSTVEAGGAGHQTYPLLLRVRTFVVWIASDWRSDAGKTVGHRQSHKENGRKKSKKYHTFMV